MSDIYVSPELVLRLRQFIEDEARSCSMDPSLINAGYVFRMWGGRVDLNEIAAALEVVRAE